MTHAILFAESRSKSVQIVKINLQSRNIPYSSHSEVLNY